MVVFAVVLLTLGFWVVVVFNSLIKLRNQVANAFKQIDVQLKRRHDLIPNLIASVKGEMKFEQETLDKVMQARAAAVSAVQGCSTGDIIANEGMLTQALGKLMAVAENYPNLKANESVKTLMEELTTQKTRSVFHASSIMTW